VCGTLLQLRLDTECCYHGLSVLTFSILVVFKGFGFSCLLNVFQLSRYSVTPTAGISPQHSNGYLTRSNTCASFAPCLTSLLHCIRRVASNHRTMNEEEGDINNNCVRIWVQCLSGEDNSPPSSTEGLQLTSSLWDGLSDQRIPSSFTEYPLNSLLVPQIRRWQLLSPFLKIHYPQLLAYLLTYFMYLLSSWGSATTRGGTILVATRCFPSVLGNQKIHYHLHKSSPLAPILSHNNLVYTTPSYPFNIHLNITHPSTFTIYLTNYLTN
jgi:hypothetical protein